MLPANELDALRLELEAVTLPDTCDILSLTRSRGSMGDFTETWGTASANVPCRLDHRSGNEVSIGTALQPVYSYVLTLPWNTTVTAANRIKHAGQTYSVKSVSFGSLNACLRCELEIIG